MSELDPKGVRESWTEKRDSQGRRVFYHPETMRPGGRRLGVFASDIDADNGDLVLAGRYLLPLPDPDVDQVDHKLNKIGKLWVTRPQAEHLFKEIGADMKQLFRQNAGLAIIGFIARGAEGLLGLGKVVLGGPQKFIVDNIVRLIIDSTSNKVKNLVDLKAEHVADILRASLLKVAEEANEVVKKVSPDIDLLPFVDEATKPFLDEIRDLFGK